MVPESYCNSSLFVKMEGEIIAKWVEILNSLLKSKVNHFQTLEDYKSAFY